LRTREDEAEIKSAHRISLQAIDLRECSQRPACSEKPVDALLGADAGT
jgi:hypothetical protein